MKLNLSEPDKRLLALFKTVFDGTTTEIRTPEAEASRPKGLMLSTDTTANGNELLKLLGRRRLALNKQDQHKVTRSLLRGVLKICCTEKPVFIVQIAEKLFKRNQDQEISVAQVAAVRSALDLAWKYGLLDSLEITDKGKEWLTQ